MPWALRAYKIEPDGQVAVEHVFYGYRKIECDERFRAHRDICPKFGPADRAGDVVTVWEEIEEIPTRESIEAESDESEDE